MLNTKIGYKYMKEAYAVINQLMSKVDKNRSLVDENLKNESSDVQAFSDRKYNKWSEDENKRYCLFLQENIAEFYPNRTRRSKNFFNRMSQFLDEMRDNEQCRSHHQKMLKKHGTVENIIENLKRTDGKSVSSKEDDQGVKTTSFMHIAPLDVDYQQDSHHTIDMFMYEPEQILYNDPFSQFFGPEQISFVE